MVHYRAVTHDHFDPAPETGNSPTAFARACRVAHLAAEHADHLDRNGAFPAALIQALFSCGLLHAPLPPAMGGMDLGLAPGDPVVLAEILAVIGGGSLPLGRLYEGHVNAVKLVRLYGSTQNLDDLKVEADAGYLTGVWMAEDDQPLILDETGRGLRLRGRKILASGAGHVRRPLVAARTAQGSVLLLPRITPSGDHVDVSGWTALGMKATATGTVSFEGIMVAPGDIVGCPGDYLRSPYFRGGAWRVMAVQLGAIQALVAAHRRQLTELGRDGDPMQRARFAEAVVSAETARLWVREAARTAEDEAGDPDAIDTYVDLMRGAFERVALDVIEAAQKAIGLKAFLHGHPVERIARDLATYLRQPALDASRSAAADYFFHHALPGNYS